MLRDPHIIQSCPQPVICKAEIQNLSPNVGPGTQYPRPLLSLGAVLVSPRSSEKPTHPVVLSAVIGVTATRLLSSVLNALTLMLDM